MTHILKTPEKMRGSDTSSGFTKKHLKTVEPSSHDPPAFLQSIKANAYEGEEDSRRTEVIIREEFCSFVNHRSPTNTILIARVSAKEFERWLLIGFLSLSLFVLFVYMLITIIWVKRKRTGKRCQIRDVAIFF